MYITYPKTLLNLLRRGRQLSCSGGVLWAVHRSFSEQNITSDNMTSSKDSRSGRSYQIVEPGIVSPLRTVPGHILKPPYAAAKGRLANIVHNNLVRGKTKIEIKNEKQIIGMRDACRLARDVLMMVGERVKIGVTTDELDAVVHGECIHNNAYPSPLLYRRFPKSVCTSVNNVACHGIPDDRQLCNGDLINIDVTVYYRGYHGDLSKTYIVGEVDDAGRHLVNAAKLCCDNGIEVCGPGRPINTVGETVQRTAEGNLCHVVPVFCGHGIGSYFHGPPDIIHVVNDIEDLMQEGMTFTVEPVITEGEPGVTVLDDGWTVISVDGSRSAQFEHTILITKHGFEILTI